MFTSRGVHLTMPSLRLAAGKTQEDVSAATGIDLADVSQLESREGLGDTFVSTLQRYLAALGAVFELKGNTLARMTEARLTTGVYP